MQADGTSRKRSRMKKTWIEVVKDGMKKRNLIEDLAKDRRF